MLNRIYIKDYAIVDELEVRFEDGLLVITGETGAGKSIIIGALALLCGERGHSDLVRSGSTKAILEAEFKVQKKGETRLLGDGEVLNLYSERIKKREMEKRVAFLRRLQGDEKDMLFALIQEKGVLGLRESELRDFCSLGKSSFHRFSQELEAEGKIKILAFSPLFLLSQRSLNFLLGRVLAGSSPFL